MSFDCLIVIVVLVIAIGALIRECMRPGLILLTASIVFMCLGILTPKEMLEGFSNKGMITVGLLFLVSEGVRRSGLLGGLIERLLPQGKAGVRRVHLRMLPAVSFISAFLNNTPVVVIFAPMIKRWAEHHGQAATKFLIPLSYATILGGMCTLIGTSTNLVVNGMVVESGFEGFSMFELGKVGLIIAVVGLLYITFVSPLLLPQDRADRQAEELSLEQEAGGKLRRVEVVLGARFPAIGKKVRDFDFPKKYGAMLVEIRRAGQTFIMHDMRSERFREGDTLVLLADQAFMSNWGDSSFFLMVSAAEENKASLGRFKAWLAVGLVVLMVAGATIGELPSVKAALGSFRLDMFFFVCITTALMAVTGIFPARKYTKFVSWDILVTIAAAFAVSKAMQNSGMADAVAGWAVGLTDSLGPTALLVVVYVITNLFTELMTNNAAAALAFPISLSMAQALGASPIPFFVAICIAASASFSTPIGYQTNLIVQGVGGYRFADFVRVGLPLNLICLLLTALFVPLIWPFFPV